MAKRRRVVPDVPDVPDVPEIETTEENRANVMRFSESSTNRWIERLAKEPGSSWVATWHDPGGAVRRSRVRSMRCQAIGGNGLQCKRSVVIGAPLCASHTERVFGLAVRPSPIAGNGLFTTVDREAGALLCPYAGRWFRAGDLHVDFAGDYAYTTNDRRWTIDALGLRSVGSLANTVLTAHTEMPRTMISDPAACNAFIAEEPDGDGPGFKVVLKALKPLARGDEILVNYGTEATFPVVEPGAPRNTDPAVGPVVHTRGIKSPKVRRALLTF